MRNLILAIGAAVLLAMQTMVSVVPAIANEVDDLLAEFFDTTTNPVAKIVEDFPIEREGAEASMRAAFETGNEKLAMLAGHSLGQDLGAKYTAHYMARTSKDAVLGYLQMQFDSTNELAGTDGVACFHWAFGTATEPVSFSDAVTQMQLSSFSRIIMEKADSPRTMDGSEFEAVSERIGLMMGTHFDADHLFFDGLTNPGAVSEPGDKRKTCLTWWAYLAGIKLLPQDDAAAYFRTMMTMQ